MSPITKRSITFRDILAYALVGTVIAGFAIYVLFQARFIIQGPQIALTGDTPLVSSGRVVVLQGIARNIVRITLDGRQIYTDKYGNFKEAVILENGYTIATLQAEDRYGRTTTITKQFVHINEDSNALSFKH